MPQRDLRPHPRQANSIKATRPRSPRWGTDQETKACAQGDFRSMSVLWLHRMAYDCALLS